MLLAQNWPATRGANGITRRCKRPLAELDRLRKFVREKSRLRRCARSTAARSLSELMPFLRAKLRLRQDFRAGFRHQERMLKLR